MTRRGRTNRQDQASGGLLALLPLAMVFAAIAFLAVGAGRMGPETNPAATDAAQKQAADTTEADQAAAAAIVAISLARVAPPLPEEALEAPKPKPQQATGEASRPKKPAAAREAQPGPQQQLATARPANAPAAVDQPQQTAAQPPKAKPEDEGVLARIGSYAPSPTRIVGAVSDGVSKLARYIPGL